MRRNNKRLYESIIRDVSKIVKKHLNEVSKEMTDNMLRKHSGDGDDPEEGYYGYGVWIIDGNGRKDIPYFQGCDPGVSFISEFDPNTNRISVFVSNYGDNVWAIARKIRGGA